MMRRRAFLALAGYALAALALMCIFYGAVTVPSPPPAAVASVTVDLQERLESLQQRVGHAEILLQRRWRDVLQAEAAAAERAGLSPAPVVLNLPSIFDYLPYLRNSTRLEPALRISNSSRNASDIRVVLGIPSVKREIQSYLTSTVENLIANMSPQEREITLIVILLADTNSSKVESELADIHGVLEQHLRSGLVEVVNPPAHFYPSLEKLSPTLGDPIERVRWRTKQAFDFAYLMMYGSSRGEFYVQLEDDILSKPGFVSHMLNFAHRQLAAGRHDFFVLDFCSLGFIGKMFKCVDLMRFATYILTFARDQPVDWILDHYVQTKVCRFDRDARHCRKMKSTIWITYKPSLFQHVGTHSSLRGKTQRLKDRQFGRVSLFVAHRDNVPGEIVTSMRSYKQFSIRRAYLGDSLFWGLLPVAGDHISVAFHQPTLLDKVLFRSGDAEHPNDRFVNASIQVLPVPQARAVKTGASPASSVAKEDGGAQDTRDTPNQPVAPAAGAPAGSGAASGAQPLTTSDGWQEIARFDPHTGVAQAAGPFPWPVVGLRVVVLSDHDHWGILSEIEVKGRPAPNRARRAAVA